MVTQGARLPAHPGGPNRALRPGTDSGVASWTSCRRAAHPGGMDRRVMIVCDVRASGITAELDDSYLVRVEPRPNGGALCIWTDLPEQARVFGDARRPRSADPGRWPARDFAGIDGQPARVVAAGAFLADRPRAAIPVFARVSGRHDLDPRGGHRHAPARSRRVGLTIDQRGLQQITGQGNAAHSPPPADPGHPLRLLAPYLAAD